MSHKTKPAAASLAPTHLVQEHQGVCILALPASFRKAVSAERWDEIYRELHAQVLELIERLPAAVHFVAMPLCVAQILGDADAAEIGELLTQEEFILTPRGRKGDASKRAATRTATSKKGASRA
ncbi:hypothetical protein AcdelDRAFT_2506 [Acidovorax delafieldii 2AN]|uniref:Uncharacterized protein n=1 Tax=Acidovorax delafieldii 2AN TaxID=573060 RepID=C5T6H6_ACIDE|nr:hypothetical protein [Acidovorax delafieldii]EER59920.1 hypothetical protein AcdelDRAFT_2506 [Acidovorax delafieldii 2AN]